MHDTHEIHKCMIDAYIYIYTYIYIHIYTYIIYTYIYISNMDASCCPKQSFPSIMINSYNRNKTKEEEDKFHHRV